jgi:hypothetical protein
MDIIEINFPNEPFPYSIPLSIASKWVLRDVKIIGDMAFFNVGGIMLSCGLEEYQVLMLAIQK